MGEKCISAADNYFDMNIEGKLLLISFKNSICGQRSHKKQSHDRHFDTSETLGSQTTPTVASAVLILQLWIVPSFETKFSKLYNSCKKGGEGKSISFTQLAFTDIKAGFCTGPSQNISIL
ncbi:hypothetical protein AMECASPLE_035627 [Ameca splendens]|uniref:Uncharacterized protein n=1 Tax=Ameca splendens TaxID=208324 RepID=A0ABV0YIH3_9TELE